MNQESKWAKSQNGPKVKMGQESKWDKGYKDELLLFIPERVKLTTVNSKKETNVNPNRNC